MQRKRRIRMKKITPDIHCLRVMQIIISAAGILIAALLAETSVPERLRLILGGSIIAVALGYSLIYLPLFFFSIKYTVTESEITVSKGVFIRRRQAVKFSSVRYVTAVDFPLLRFVSFSTVIFFVYGGKLAVPFLSVSDMRELLRLASKED